VRILVIGASGMLGHRVARAAAQATATWATVRDHRAARAVKTVAGGADVVPDVEVRELSRVATVLETVRPDAVINCAGVIKQQVDAGNETDVMLVNAHFPHALARACADIGAHLIHVSTDCVFSGHNGPYSEGDVADPIDLYGRSKLLGEVTGPACTTVRTSIIGRELASRNGLVEWLLSRHGGVAPAWTDAWFSGLTTPVLAELLVRLAMDPPVEGLWHVGGPPIAKASLLELVREAFDLDVTLEPESSVVIDRRLDSSRFRAAFDWSPPDWPTMVRTLAADVVPYDELHRSLGVAVADGR
jgi:dTDP-4-dehydrorhamnose reductase